MRRDYFRSLLIDRRETLEAGGWNNDEASGPYFNVELPVARAPNTASDTESRRHSPRPESSQSNRREMTSVGEPECGHCVEKTKSRLCSPSSGAFRSTISHRTSAVAGKGRPIAALYRARVWPNPSHDCAGISRLATITESTSRRLTTTSIASAVKNCDASDCREKRR